MDHQKLDARLSETLATAAARAYLDVFVEIARDATEDDLDRLTSLGVPRPHGDESLVTATLRPGQIADVTDVPAVRQVRLSRRLRHP